MDILRCMKILRSQSKNRLYTKLLRIHLFSFFIIKMPQALAALMPLNREDTDKYTVTIKKDV